MEKRANANSQDDGSSSIRSSGRRSRTPRGLAAGRGLGLAGRIGGLSGGRTQPASGRCWPALRGCTDRGPGGQTRGAGPGNRRRPGRSAGVFRPVLIGRTGSGRIIRLAMAVGASTSPVDASARFGMAKKPENAPYGVQWARDDRWEGTGPRGASGGPWRSQGRLGVAWGKYDRPGGAWFPPGRYGLIPVGNGRRSLHKPRGRIGSVRNGQEARERSLRRSMGSR